MSSPAAQLARRRALFAFFLLPGVLFAAWVTRTPAIRDALTASLADMGLVLAGLSVGSMTGLLGAGPLVRRWGTRPVVLGGMVLVISAMLTLALANALGVLPLASLALLLFGLGMGSAELGINLEGAEVERLSGRIIMPTLHGCFSLGTVIGALTSLALIELSVPVTWHLLAMAGLGVLLLLPFLDSLPRGFGRDDAGTAVLTTQARPLWREPSLLLIGLIALAMALAEGAAYDWLPLLMADEYGTGEMSGTLVFLGFAATMALGRFGGALLLRRLQRHTLLRISIVLGGSGLAMVIGSEQLAWAVTGVVLWGLGTSVAFPLALSAAAASGSDSNGRVKLVATGGYIALLVGPPMLGFIAHSLGLRGALGVVLSIMIIALAATPAVPRSTAGKATGGH